MALVLKRKYGELEIEWIREPYYERSAPTEGINFRSSTILWMIAGRRGAGKSNTAEFLGEQYLNSGSAVIDAYGAQEGESLGWLRSPYAGLVCPDCDGSLGVRVERNKRKNSSSVSFLCNGCGREAPEVRAGKIGARFLLLHGKDVELKLLDEGIAAKLSRVGRLDLKQMGKLSQEDLSRYDVVISTTLFYSSPASENSSLDKLAEMLMLRPSWNRICYAIVREAADIFYSRLKTKYVEGGRVKEDYAALLRKARHQGVCIAFDTQRYIDIDKEFRKIADFTIFKAIGDDEIPREKRWIHNYISHPRLMRLPKSEAVITTNEGNIGRFSVPLLPWHKVEGEDMLALFGIKRIVLQPYEIRTELSPLEHFEIVNLYKHGASMIQIAGMVAKVRGSLSSWTVDKQIQAHNRAVNENMRCPLCAEIEDNGGIDVQQLVVRAPRVKDASPLFSSA